MTFATPAAIRDVDHVQTGIVVRAENYALNDECVVLVVESEGKRHPLWFSNFDGASLLQEANVDLPFGMMYRECVIHVCPETDKASFVRFK